VFFGSLTVWFFIHIHPSAPWRLWRACPFFTKILSGIRTRYNFKIPGAGTQWYCTGNRIPRKRIGIEYRVKI